MGEILITVVLIGGIIGVIAMLISWIWVVVIAFRESIGWGIGSLLLNPIALIYALMNRDRCKRPLLLFSAGFLLYAILMIVELSR